jgi:hypothetical protein
LVIVKQHRTEVVTRGYVANTPQIHYWIKELMRAELALFVCCLLVALLLQVWLGLCCQVFVQHGLLDQRLVAVGYCSSDH